MARSERRQFRSTHTVRSNERRRGVAGHLHAASLGRLRRWSIAGGLLLCMSACTRTGRGANAADVERQSEAEYDLAREFFGRRDPRTALAHAQKAVELNDQNADAHHYVALIYLSFCETSPAECRLPDAERACRRAIEVRPDFREAENTLGVILIHERKFTEAVAVLQPLAGDILYQTPWNAWGNLGWAYLEQGRPDEAIQALRRSVAAEPRFCVGNYRLGLALEKKGELVAAREALSRAVDRPECRGLQDAFEARARVNSKSKNCDLAKGDWERCKEISAESPAGQRCLASLKSSPC